MILYHGSNIEVSEPQIIVSNRALDFGAGFYTTSSEDQAIRWARLQALRRSKGTPVANDNTMPVISDYMAGTINEETALILLKPQKLADQYAFLTWQGLSMLRFIRGTVYE